MSTVWKTCSSSMPELFSWVGKIIMISFFNYHEIVYQHEVSLHITITGDTSSWLAEHIHWKHLHYWCLHMIMHTLGLPMFLLSIRHNKMMPQPPYNPDLTPSDFFCFLTWNQSWWVFHFPNNNSEKGRGGSETVSIKWVVAHLPDWQICWANCIQFDGDYLGRVIIKLDCLIYLVSNKFVLLLSWLALICYKKQRKIL